MKLALGNLNPIVGDLSGNFQQISEFVRRSYSSGAELVVLPELALTGYPAQDLLLRSSFVEYAHTYILELERLVQKLGSSRPFFVVLGSIAKAPVGATAPLVNAAFVLGVDGIVGVRAKSLIPHYDIFNERRYFASALDLDPEWRSPVELGDLRVGILICEDSWHQTQKYARPLYTANPTEHLVASGARFLVNLSASPYQIGKKDARRAVIVEAARAHGIPIAYVNQLGAQDEIIFDGDAFVVDSNGKVEAESGLFTANAAIWSIPKAVTNDSHREKGKETLAALDTRSILRASDTNALAEVHQALVLGIRDYAKKNGFKRALLGLSGGIDSALCACLAVDALGAENVHAISMPSKYSSVHSIEDAEALAKINGISCDNFSIKFLQSTVELNLKPFFGDRERDVAEENIQARLRGLVLMAMSNKFGHMLLATGNKSELAVGYSTLYGDMCGAIAPIGDLYKTEVYALSRYLNSFSERIPESTMQKPPSAELRPDQKDADSLPEYDVLDQILFRLIEEEESLDQAVAGLAEQGISAPQNIVKDVERMLWRAEYKRKQFGPVLRVSQKAFGIGRGYPLTARIPLQWKSEPV